MKDKIVYTTETVVCNTRAKMRQYWAACREEAKSERIGKHKKTIALAKHDNEFVDKVIFVPKELLDVNLTKDDLRLLVV